MNFDFSDDQKELKAQARRFLDEQCPFTVPRRVLETDEPYATDLWRAVCAMGWPAATIPEAHGGIGLGYLELCVIAEELGRAVAPIPFSSSVYLATEAILQFGTDVQKETYLPRLATGEIIGTLAIAEGTSTLTPESIKTKASGGTVSGEKLPVPDGDVADFAVVVATANDHVGLYLVDLSGDGVTRSTVSTVDPTRSHAKITLNGAPAESLGEGDSWANLERLLNRAAVLFAFEQLGGARRCLEMARAYSLERYAFGRPIGSFQAVKHRMADIYIKNELATSNCYYGAWALATDADELPLAAACSRVAATEAYHFASKENIQIHGGMGFTWEYDAHFFYRRSKLLALALGGPRHWKDRLVTHLETQSAA